MDPEIQGYSDFIDMLLEKADSHAASLSTDALNWQPLDADTNSVAALCAHMCGVVRWWVQQGLTGNDVGRQRDTEFVATVDADGNLSFWGTRRPISDVISETRAISREILANFDPSALTQNSAVDTLGPQLNRWALVHTIDELAQHIGHLELTIQLQKAQA